MKKAFSIIMILLVVLGSTGAVFAAENGVDALADEKNPAFEVYSMDEMDEMGMVILTNNEDLHFSLEHGHIMIPGDASEYTDSPIFVTMEHHEGSHLAPYGRIKLFKHVME